MKINFPPSPFQNAEKKNKRSITKKLMKKYNNKCYWCGCEVALSPAPQPKGFVEFDNMATTDHLFSKLDIRRPLSDLNHTVLACRLCNQHRSYTETTPFTDHVKEYMSFNLINITPFKSTL